MCSSDLTLAENTDYTVDYALGRELKNLVERTMLVASKPLIDVCDLPPEALRAESTGNLENIERQAVADALRRHDGNLSQAAADLGVTRQTLYRRMAKYGLGR